MKNKIKKNLLCLTAVALASSALSAQTGCISSKSINPDPPHVSTEQMEIISNSRFLPWNSPDGGKAYFNAWNGLENGKDFQYFLEECHEKIENEKSAKTLEDSDETEEWLTKEIDEKSKHLSFLEDSTEFPQGKFFLRVDTENRVIYTVKKSGDHFLFEFYLLFYRVNTSYLSLTCQAVSSDIRNYINVLLPTDKELIN